MKKNILKPIFIAGLIAVFVSSGTITLGQMIIKTRQKEYIKEICIDDKMANSKVELGEGITGNATKHSNSDNASEGGDIQEVGGQRIAYDSEYGAEITNYEREIKGEMPPYEKVSDEEKKKDIKATFGLPKDADIVGVNDCSCKFYLGKLEVEYTKYVSENNFNMEDLYYFDELKTLKGKMIIYYAHNQMGDEYDYSDVAKDNQYIVHIYLSVGEEEYSIDINPFTQEYLRYISYPSNGNTKKELKNIKKQRGIDKSLGEDDDSGYEIENISDGVKDKYRYLAYSFICEKFGGAKTDLKAEEILSGDIEAVNGGKRFTITIFCELKDGRMIQVVMDEAKPEVIGYIVNPFI